MSQEVVDEVLAEHREEQARQADQAAEIASIYNVQDDEPAPGSDEATAAHAGSTTSVVAIIKLTIKRKLLRMDSR